MQTRAAPLTPLALPALPPLSAQDLEMLPLRGKQFRFVLMTAHLVTYAHGLGYVLTQGDGYRDPRVFGELGERRGYGESRSAHKQRLAVDYNLFIDGVYRTDTKAHSPLGEFWESLGGAWGGRFGDGNHYSLEHEGVK